MTAQTPDNPDGLVWPYTDERVDEIIATADAWIDAWWHGTLSPHGDDGPLIAVTELARAYRDRPKRENTATQPNNR